MDIKHHLIVAHEVTNVGTDRSQFSHMAKRTKAALKTDKLDVVADRGYFSGEEILACDKDGITVTLPKPMTSGSRAKGRFVKQDCLSGRKRRLSLPRRRTPDLPLRHRGKGPDFIPLLDNRLPYLRHQGSMHHGQAAPDYPLGARTCS